MTKPCDSELRAEAPVRAVVSLGANLGAPAETLRLALDALDKTPGVRLLKTSRFYDTSPVDSSGPNYVNAAALIETTLAPLALLHAMQAIENRFGRVRPAGIHNAPRTLDLDLLLFGSEKRETAELTLPHPRMLGRLFVLIPLQDIAPDWRGPDGARLPELIERVRKADPSQTIRLLAPSTAAQLAES